MIPEFKDAEGGVWKVNLTAGLLRRVRTETGIALGSILTDDQRLSRLLYADPEALADVLLVVALDYRPTYDAARFLEALDAAAIDDARGALLEALANFTLPPAISKAFAANWRHAVTTKAGTLAATLTTTLNPTPTSSGPATPSAASSA